MDEKLRAHVLKRDSMNTFMHYNFNEQAELEQDYAVCKLDIRPESLNPFGMVHGGALCTLADNAAGMAAHTDGRLYVTQSSTFQFVKNRAAEPSMPPPGCVTGDGPRHWFPWRSRETTTACWRWRSLPCSAWAPG